MATFASDSFTDGTTQQLHLHTGEVGATWTFNSFEPGATNTALYVVNTLNRVRGGPSSVGGMYYVSGTSVNADYDVSADLIHKTTTDSNVQVAGRVATGADDAYLFGYYGPGTAWYLQKHVAGTASNIAGPSSQTLTADQVYRLTLRMVGTTITGLVDGAQILSVTDSSISAAGRAGLRGNWGVGVNGDTVGFHFDNFQANDPIVVSTAPTLRTVRSNLRW